MPNNQGNLSNTEETITAFVDTVIPRTPNLALKYGNVMYYGAVDLQINEYMIMMLNYFYIPMADITAKLLDFFAYQLYNNDNTQNIIYIYNFNRPGVFLSLSPDERLRSLQLLDYLSIYFSVLLLQYQGYPGIMNIISSLDRYTVRGYYSEWFGYGSTKLEKPRNRVLQFHPISWEQVGYPGPSFTYISEVRAYYQINENRGL